MDASTNHANPCASVVITTRNRPEELRQALSSVMAQTVQPEVLVMDDGSTEGMTETTAREFPSVHWHRSPQSLGYIVQRNRAARLARGTILISLDDDAKFSSPTVIEQTLREFDHPRVGAVAIPVVDVNRSSFIYQRAPQPGVVYASYCFIGTAHALRRNLFLSLGGYREILIHQSEEEDYCIRMLDAGYITRCGTADPIHHFESPRRSFARMDYFGARNKVLYAWHNVPFPNLPVHLAATTIMTTVHSLKPSRMLTRIRGVLNAYAVILASRTSRQPVTVNSYRVSRDLKLRGPQPVCEIEEKLPGVSSLHPLIPCES